MSFEALKPFTDSLAQWEKHLQQEPQAATAAFLGVFGSAQATLLEALRYEGFTFPGEDPKDVLKKAFTANWIDDAQLWLDMLADRNRLAHGQTTDLPPHRLFAYFTELRRLAEIIKARPHVPPVVQELAEQIGHLPRVKRVILFGSRARGDNQPRSDVDLAIEAEDEEAIHTARQLADEAPTLLEIDLVALPEATAELRSEIESEGIVLFPRS